MDGYYFLIDPKHEALVEQYRDRRGYSTGLLGWVSRIVKWVLFLVLLSAYWQIVELLRVATLNRLILIVAFLIYSGVILTVFMSINKRSDEQLITGEVIACHIEEKTDGKRDWTLMYRYTPPRSAQAVERSITIVAPANPLAVPPEPGDRLAIHYINSKKHHVL